MRRAMIGKFLTCVAVLLLLAGSVGTSTVMGALILRETFSDPDGSLVGDTPEIGGVWTNHSGTVGQMQVVSGQAKVNHTLSEDAHADFDGGAIGAGDKIYAAFDLTVPTQTAAPGNVYFAHFKDAANFFGARIFITAPIVAGNGFRLGVSGNATLIATETWASDLAFDTMYRVVTSYDYDSGATKMWVDPSNEASTSISALDGIATDEYVSYSLRESTANSMQLIDCLQVATSFDEAAICIPEPGTMALIFLAGLALVGLARRRS